MKTTHLRRLAGIALVAGLVAAGCGGDDDKAEDAGSGDETTTEAADETTTEATEDSTESTEATEESTEPAASGEDVTEPVTAAFTAFFANFAGDPALLEDGETFQAGIDALRASAAAAGEIGVAVNGVTTIEDSACESAGTIAPCAEVAYDLVVNGDPVVPDQTGYAVYQDDTWKVSKATFCALTALGDGPPEGC